MKKKILIAMFVVICMSLLALVASAEAPIPPKPLLDVEFGTVTTIDGFTPPSQLYVNTDERVLLVDKNGNYVTYPSYYITKDSATFDVNFNSLNSATGKNYSKASVAMLEIPEGVTTISNSTFSGTGYTVCVYVQFPSTITTFGNNVFNTNKACRIVEFVDGKEPLAIGDGMFSGAWNGGTVAEYVKFPNNAVSIGNNTFGKTLTNKTIIFGENLESIGTGFFGETTPRDKDTFIYIPEKFFADTSKVFANLFGNHGHYHNNHLRLTIFYTGSQENAKKLADACAALQTGYVFNNVTYVSASEYDYATHKPSKDLSATIVYNYDPCKAFYSEYANGINASCENSGRTYDVTCSHCDKVFAVSEAIPALGHDIKSFDAKNPTCTEKGWNAYEACSRCDYTTYEEIPASGHAWTVTGSACENNCGLTRGAYIGNTNYATFAEAYAAANAGDEIVLVTDIESSEIITIDKAIILNGNGYTLNSTAARGINVSDADGITIKNLTINCTGERAINVINGATNVTIKNVTATAANYAVNVAGSASEAVVTINDSTLTGLNVVNVAANNVQITINNSSLTCNDNAENEIYGVIGINTVNGVTVTVNGGSVTVNGDSYGASVFGNSAVTFNGTEGNTIVKYVVATIGEAGYYTIEAAIKGAKDGETIVLLRDITASEIITINKSITINGNGKTLTSTASRAINVDVAGNVVISNLTINAGERAINIINKPSNVTLNNVTATAANNAVMLATSAQGANLTVNNCDFTGLATVNVASANSVVVINDTKITNVDSSKTENYGAISIFKTAENSSVAVNGGEIIVSDDSVAISNGIPSASYTVNGTVGADKVQNVIAYVGDAGYTTLADAINAAKDGATVDLYASVILDTLIKIEKSITLNLNGNTVTANTRKAFEIYANVTIQNGTIKAQARCIDTRTAVNLTLNSVSLVADKYYNENQQPLTIGGYDNGTVVTMNNVTIDAGTQGYCITTFVKTTLNAVDSVLSGYILVNVQSGSDNSSFTLENCDLTTDITKNDVIGNAVASIYVNSSNVSVNLDKESSLTLKGNYACAVSIFDINTVNVTLPSANANDVIKSEFAVVDNGNGTLTVVCAHNSQTVVDYVYANGYEKSGVEISECDECGARSEKTVKPLFKFSGYSVPEDGRGEIAIGYEINKEAIAAYESITGYKLSYGIFVALESIGTKDIFDANSGAITAAVTSTSSAFDFKITGIESAEYKALNMAMGAYVIAENGTEKTVSYMQGGKPEAEVKYIFVSYDLIASNS